MISSDIIISYLEPRIKDIEYHCRSFNETYIFRIYIDNIWVFGHEYVFDRFGPYNKDDINNYLTMLYNENKRQHKSYSKIS